MEKYDSWFGAILIVLVASMLLNIVCLFGLSSLTDVVKEMDRRELVEQQPDAMDMSCICTTSMSSK